jgi:hypothetical protein
LGVGGAAGIVDDDRKAVCGEPFGDSGSDAA